MQHFITIFFTVLEIGSFTLFQNLELGKASTDKKCQFAISWARSCQYQCLRKSYQNLPLSSIERATFIFFRIWRSAKPRPKINVILQFLGLDLFNIKLSAKFYQNIPNGLRVNFHGVHLDNINAYAKFHHNIPLSSRDNAIITFSEFGARQSLDQWKMSFCNLLG